MSRKIIHHGHPDLAQVALPLTFPIPNSVLDLVEELMIIMMQEKGVGIAAPQIGQSLQVIIIASRPNLRYPQAPLMEPLPMINPKILHESQEKELGWEGCLSVPDLRGQVERAKSITVSFSDLNGVQHTETYEGFVARIIQHECDHLIGKVFLDRVRSPDSVISEEQYFQEIL